MSALSGAELRDLLLVAEEEVRRSWVEADKQPKGESLPLDSGAHTMLDRIAQTGIVLIENRQDEDFRLVIDTLIHLFRAAGKERPPTLIVSPLATEQQALRWFDIANRVYLLGAISVSLNVFSVIRQLVLQQPNEARKGRFWLRDTVTALARLNRFRKEPGAITTKPLLGPISEYIAERPVFYRRFRNNKDDVVSYLCRFDFLECVISVAETGDLSACYPNFGGFYKERTEPIVVDMVTGGKSRETLPGVDDKKLAGIILELDHLADREFFSYVAWDEGHWSDNRVTEFLASYGAGEQQNAR